MVAALGIVLAACSGTPTASTGVTPSGASAAAPSSAPSGPQYDGAIPGSGAGMKIGYVSLGDSLPFIKIVSDGIRAEAKVAGADLIFCDSEIDAAKALACVQNFKVQGVQGILNFQLDEAAAAEICKAGPQVPVIGIDIHQRPCEIAFMGANNTLAGNLVGAAVGNAMKEQFNCEYDAIVIMTALSAGEVIKLRTDGTTEGFKSVCGELKNFTAIDVPSIGIDEARTKFSDYLTSVPDARRVVAFSLNDDMGLGVLAAAEASGRAADVYMGTHTGDRTAWKQVRCNDHWIADVAYLPDLYGKTGIPAIIDAIAGKVIPKEMLTNHVVLTKDTILEIYPDAPSC
jgi:ribose transport system substrate-binding protein